MFRVFVVFCIFNGVVLVDVNVKVILAFLECLVQNKCSNAMVENYVLAIKASFVLYELPFVVFNHSKIKYFIKSPKINSPLTLTSHNLIDLHILGRISTACLDLPHRVVYRAIFLTAFFAFMRLSNLAPHSLPTFGPSRHLTGHDVFFTKKFAKLLIKWSKTLKPETKFSVLQETIGVQLQDHCICPVRALKELFRLYPMSSHSSLFQLTSSLGSSPVTDSRVRKTLKTLNLKLGFHLAGATFAFNSHVPI